MGMGFAPTWLRQVPLLYKTTLTTAANKLNNADENMTSLAEVKWCEDLICGGTLSPVSSGMGDCLRAGKLSHYVTSHPGNLAFRPSSVGK